MKLSVLIIAALSYFAGAAVTYAILRATSMGNPELTFVVGAILGSLGGAIVHHRDPCAKSTVVAKAIIGVVFAVCAVIVGMGLHLTTNAFKFVEISLPFAAVGSFVFPFVLLDTIWNSMPTRGSDSKPKDV